MSDITFNLERDSKQNRNGLYRIYIRVTENRVHTRIKTDVFVERKDQFNSRAKNGRYIRTSHSKHAALNAELEIELQRLKDKYRQIKEESKANVSAQTLIKKINERDFKLFKDFAFEKLDEMVRANYDLGYCRQVKSKINKFLDFAGNDIALKAIDFDLLERWKVYLYEKGTYQNTIREHFRKIKMIIKAALDRDLIVKDPFRNFVMEKELPTKRLRLQDNQIKALEELVIEKENNKWRYIAQQTFLFSYYNAGIRISDIIQLRVGYLKEGRIDYEMGKTDAKKSIKLSSKSLAILAKFKQENSKPSDYLFGLLDNNAEYAKFITNTEQDSMGLALRKKLEGHVDSAASQIQQALKEIAKKLEIEETLTFHIARHSFADKARRMMKDKKVSIDDIKNALGHKNLQTTQRYLESFDKESLDIAMDEIFG